MECTFCNTYMTTDPKWRQHNSLYGTSRDRCPGRGKTRSLVSVTLFVMNTVEYIILLPLFREELIHSGHKIDEVTIYPRRKTITFSTAGQEIVSTPVSFKEDQIIFSSEIISDLSAGNAIKFNVGRNLLQLLLKSDSGEAVYDECIVEPIYGPIIEVV